MLGLEESLEVRISSARADASSFQWWKLDQLSKLEVIPLGSDSPDFHF